MGSFRTVPVVGGTTLRRGVSKKGDEDESNVIGTLAKDDYTALAQTTGQWVDEHGDTNFWWVLIDSPLGRGWVSAIQIDEGENDKPIQGVNPVVSVFDPAGTDSPTPVHVVSGGATLRRGGSTHTTFDLDNKIGHIPAGPYSAYEQCGGQDITIDGQSNFRWALLDTPQHGWGWVSAVLLAEGINNGPIPGVAKVQTVSSIPPDLIP